VDTGQLLRPLVATATVNAPGENRDAIGPDWRANSRRPF
jgi:hypothetical protein